MKCCFELHVRHVSGSRMVIQGTDGLSKGAMNAFGINSLVLRKHVPLHLTALERSSGLKEWIKSLIV